MIGSRPFVPGGSTEHTWIVFHTNPQPATWSVTAWAICANVS